MPDPFQTAQALRELDDEVHFPPPASMTQGPAAFDLPTSNVVGVSQCSGFAAADWAEKTTLHPFKIGAKAIAADAPPAEEEEEEEEESVAAEPDYRRVSSLLAEAIGLLV